MDEQEIDYNKIPSGFISYDQNWFSWLLEYGSLQAYEYLSGDLEYRSRQKEQFLAGEVENPTLDYPKLQESLTKLVELREQLFALKSIVREKEPIYTQQLSETQKEAVTKVYLQKINEKLAEIGMLIAAASVDMRNFNRYAEIVYGRPSQFVFNDSILRIRGEIEEASSSNSTSTELLDAARELLEAIPLPANNSFTIDSPSVNAYTVIAGSINQNSKDEVIEEGETFNADAIKFHFERALESLNIPGWQVIVSEDKTAISVDQEAKRVNVPATRTLSAKSLRQLILHEIETHVMRRERGEHSSLQLLGLGTARYESAEEGIATMRERALDQGAPDDYSGFNYHLAISLALGLDGTKRNFREVFEILKKYFYFKNIKNGKLADKARDLAGNSAWSTCVRVFRGTDCSTRGVCFRKDIAYREGSIFTWYMVGQFPGSIMLFDVGKFSPYNPGELYVLVQLGILDEDLNPL